MKLGFIGAGNMGGAILKGMLAGGKIATNDIFIRNSSDKSTEEVARKNGIQACSSLKEVVTKSDIIFIGVKPYLVANVLQEIKEELADKIVVSMAASVEIGDIESIIPNVKVVRIMPNTPVEIGAGVIGVSFSKIVSEDEQAFIGELLNNIGIVEIISEKDMSGLTAISGSGPAYVYMFIEALADGAVLNGLRRDVAYRLAANTVLGGAKMVLETNEHPGKLKDDVCSPAGSTIEAVRVLEKNNFRSAVIECERACFEKLSKM